MKKRKIVGSAILGNIVEYYDFGIYAVYASTIGRVFFPDQHDPVMQNLFAFMVFAVGFLMRPMGGFVFGHIGDRFGRKVSLTISILGMAAATFMIGLLPGFNQIGYAAPVILILIRLFQGLCVGGESAGVAIFVLEHLDGYKPGLIGGIVMASNMVGTLIAYFVGMGLANYCGVEGQLDDFCWRYGFLLGGIMGIVGIYMRFQLKETPKFEEQRISNTTLARPLLEAMKKHWPRMLVIAFLGGITTAMAYTIRAYLKTFLQDFMGYPADEAIYFTTISLFIMIIFMPIFGILADHMSYRKFFYRVCYIVILTIVPVFMLITSPEKDMLLIGVVLLGLLSSAICAPAYPYAISAFEVELRYSAMAFSWNLGNAILGGTTPVISTYLAAEFGHVAPAYYLAGLMFAFMAVSYATRKYKH